MKQLILTFSPRSFFFMLGDCNNWLVSNANEAGALGVILTGFVINSYGNPPYSYELGGDSVPLDKDGFPALPTPPSGKNTISGEELGKALFLLDVTATPRQQKWIAERFGETFPALKCNKTHTISVPIGTITPEKLTAFGKRCGIDFEETSVFYKLNTKNYRGIFQENGGGFYLTITGETAGTKTETLSVIEEPGNQYARRAIELLAFELQNNKIEIVTLCG